MRRQKLIAFTAVTFRLDAHDADGTYPRTRLKGPRGYAEEWHVPEGWRVATVTPSGDHFLVLLEEVSPAPIGPYRTGGAP